MDVNLSDISEIKVVGICGSLRPGSYTKMAVNLTLEASSKLNVQINLLDFRDYNLPFCDGNENEEAYPADVNRFRNEIKEAHGLIIGTPEYHGSYSGVLKNALDLLGFKEMEGKMIGLLCVSGGRVGGFNALSNLRNIGRKLHAWVAPEEVTIANASNAFDSKGQLTSAEMQKRITLLGEQVARFSFLHCAEKATDFLNLWEGAPDNPGG